MNAKQLLVKSERLQEQAKVWLDRTQLVNILSQFGEVKLEGAYAYGLMMESDIDFYVVSDEVTRAKAIELFEDIVKKVRLFYGYRFNDFVHQIKQTPMPKGYYYNFYAIDGDQRWRFDIWFLDKKQAAIIQKYPKMIDEGLDEKKKLTILNFKDFRNRENLKIPSVKIYDAVLSDNIMTIEELREYLKR